MYEEMIVTGAWWDYVDEIARHRLRVHLQSDRPAMRDTDATVVDGPGRVDAPKFDLCQRRAKDEPDLDLFCG